MLHWTLAMFNSNSSHCTVVYNQEQKVWAYVSLSCDIILNNYSIWEKWNMKNCKSEKYFVLFPVKWLLLFILSSCLGLYLCSLWFNCKISCTNKSHGNWFDCNGWASRVCCIISPFQCDSQPKEQVLDLSISMWQSAKGTRFRCVSITLQTSF